MSLNFISLFVVLQLRVFWKVHNVCRDRVVSVGYDVKFPFHIEPNLMFWSQPFPNPTSILSCFVVRLRIAPFFVLNGSIHLFISSQSWALSKKFKVKKLFLKLCIQYLETFKKERTFFSLKKT